MGEKVTTQRLSAWYRVIILNTTVVGDSNGLLTNEVREPTNPPLLTALLAPIAYTSPARAWIIYSILSLLITLEAFWFCIRRWQPETSRRTQSGLLLVTARSPTFLSLLIYSRVQGFIPALCMMTVAFASRSHSRRIQRPFSVSSSSRASIECSPLGFPARFWSLYCPAISIPD